MITNFLAITFTVGYLGVTAWLCRGFRFTTKSLCYGAIVIAMTLVLSCVYIPLPTGASITMGSWLPLMILALIYDYRLSMLSGLICGMLAPFLLPGWSIVHWAQYFLEYMTIFSCMGYAGVFGHEKKSRIVLGGTLAVVLRIVAQVLSGVIFFGQYAWEGWGAWAYSLTFHLTAKVPEGILSILILLALPIGYLSKIVKKGK